MHRRRQQGRELGIRSYIDYFELYIANFIGLHSLRHVLIKMKNRLMDVDYGLLYKQSTFLTMIGL